LVVEEVEETPLLEEQVVQVVVEDKEDSDRVVLLQIPIKVLPEVMPTRLVMLAVLAVVEQVVLVVVLHQKNQVVLDCSS
jgi:hypothetical protein